QPLYRDCGGLSRVTDPNAVPPTHVHPATILPEILGGAACEFKAGHSEWTDGQVHHTGFTTAFTPNRRVDGNEPSGRPADFDVTGQREKRGGPTFAAITARSHHPGGVNVLMGDGSVRFVKDAVDGATWRALGTVSGGEALSADAF
ncbi:MAG: H-X9-DG-CTERM domain-containing protein, partial [Isosphaeraceae bacterium]